VDDEPFRRIMDRWRLAAGLVMAVLAGCTSGSDRPTLPSTTSTTRPIPMAVVTGQLHVAGGPAPGRDVPVDGRIEVHRDTATGAVVETVEAASDGGFRISLPPGSYVFLGSTPHVVFAAAAGSSCGQAAATVHDGDNPPITVYCLIP
jgi:hypothetical protein